MSAGYVGRNNAGDLQLQANSTGTERANWCLRKQLSQLLSALLLLSSMLSIKMLCHVNENCTALSKAAFLWGRLWGIHKYRVGSTNLTFVDAFITNQLK